jgi:hypothetical protein
MTATIALKRAVKPTLEGCIGVEKTLRATEGRVSFMGMTPRCSRMIGFIQRDGPLKHGYQGSLGSEATLHAWP